MDEYSQRGCYRCNTFDSGLFLPLHEPEWLLVRLSVQLELLLELVSQFLGDYRVVLDRPVGFGEHNFGICVRLCVLLFFHCCGSKQLCRCRELNISDVHSSGQFVPGFGIEQQCHQSGQQLRGAFAVIYISPE